MLQFPVFGARWSKVIISGWRNRLWHLPSRCSQTGLALLPNFKEQKVVFFFPGSFSMWLLWIIIFSLRTFVVFAYIGTGGGTQSLLRSVTWTFRSLKATSSKFSSIGWAVFLIRSVWRGVSRICTFIFHQFFVVALHTKTCMLGVFLVPSCFTVDL